jgi:hypothetical protein
LEIPEVAARTNVLAKGADTRWKQIEDEPKVFTWSVTADEVDLSATRN